jgi:glycosyltransferase involved in cell wall biosynthesis
MDLYEAFRQCAITDSHIKLNVVGSGPLASVLRNTIQTDGFGRRVRIMHSTYATMPAIYQQADMFVLPSRTISTWEEQLGMVLMEAMASGLPVIAYAAGAIPEIVGNGGLLIPEGDVVHLAHSIKQVMADTQKRIKLGTMGRERAKKQFDARNTAQKIYAYYCSHLGKK